MCEHGYGGGACDRAREAALLGGACQCPAALRGPGEHGGVFLRQGRFARDVDRALFPGIQGGPLVHMIAAKAVALREAFSESFRRDQAATRRNARRLAATLERRGYRIISGGTDTHMFLMDVF